MSLAQCKNYFNTIKKQVQLRNPLTAFLLLTTLSCTNNDNQAKFNTPGTIDPDANKNSEVQYQAQKGNLIERIASYKDYISQQKKEDEIEDTSDRFILK
jgi:hypothetical protein